jgi:hypothetical protein
MRLLIVVSFMGTNFGDKIKGALLVVEAHAALTQALAAIVSVMIAVGALVYAVRTLEALQRQTDASISLTTETFRPIIEVLGGTHGQTSQIDFVNKGNGPALNFRWRVEKTPEQWRAYTSNIIAPQEKGILKGEFEWQKGLVLSYNSAANQAEIFTYVTFGSTGSVSNHHKVRQGAAVTRLGWTLLDPKLAIPGFHPDFIAIQPLRMRIRHWWRLKRGKERRL